MNEQPHESDAWTDFVVSAPDMEIDRALSVSDFPLFVPVGMVDSWHATNDREANPANARTTSLVKCIFDPLESELAKREYTPRQMPKNVPPIAAMRYLRFQECGRRNPPSNVRKKLTMRMIAVKKLHEN
jgi:hypothetical protein